MDLSIQPPSSASACEAAGSRRASAATRCSAEDSGTQPTQRLTLAAERRRGCRCRPRSGPRVHYHRLRRPGDRLPRDAGRGKAGVCCRRCRSGSSPTPRPCRSWRCRCCWSRWSGSCPRFGAEGDVVATRWRWREPGARRRSCRGPACSQSAPGSRSRRCWYPAVFSFIVARPVATLSLPARVVVGAPRPRWRCSRCRWCWRCSASKPVATLSLPVRCWPTARCVAGGDVGRCRWSCGGAHRCPLAVLLLPVVVGASVPTPTAVLLLPTVFICSAPAPTPTLKPPVVGHHDYRVRHYRCRYSFR